jgi:hypothetical protein
VNGKIYSGTMTTDVTEGFDIWIWDIESGTASYLDHAPYDQLLTDGDGHVLAYLDTESLASYYYDNGLQAYVEIHDLDTHVTRTVTPVPDMYYGVAVSGKWLAYGVVFAGDTIVLCDLEAGGYIDSEGHVIPE